MTPSVEELAFLHLVGPSPDSTGEDAPIAWELYVREQVKSKDGTPEHREWVEKMAKKLGVAA